MATSPPRWSAGRARDWYEKLPWQVGFNFVPSTAVNQLEMWQGETFDPETIERELRWAAELGFNSLRVFLHDLAWEQDRDGFIGRVRRFLEIASGFQFRTMFVFFDDCWHPDPLPGPQPEPVPGVHNSRWVQSPGNRVVRDPRQWGRLEDYVRDVVETFGEDPRVLLWDLYNEPGNSLLPSASLSWWGKMTHVPPRALQAWLAPSPSLPLLRATFRWVREVGPSQPLTAGLWFINGGLNRFQLEASDVISFHQYAGPASLRRVIRRRARAGRPLLCTEYMARPRKSRFETHLPIFRSAEVGCYHWGHVFGRTQTAFSWTDQPGTLERAEWFHDLLRPDGSPHDPAEVAVIREILRPSATHLPGSSVRA